MLYFNPAKVDQQNLFGLLLLLLDHAFYYCLFLIRDNIDFNDILKLYLHKLMIKNLIILEKYFTQKYSILVLVKYSIYTIVSTL